jgi:murein L,D-transpeptidase YafK
MIFGQLSKRTAALVAGLALACATLPAHAIEIELIGAGSDRVERQRTFAEGAGELPGTPDLARLGQRLAAIGVSRGAPIFLRVFKAESELELWVQKDDRLVLFATYPICHWSGDLGPKLIEGDRQAPEGFYTVTRRQLHRTGRWPRSLNLGFPNAFDQNLGRTGSYILVHGGCSSIGCFAMTNAVMAEIYGLAERALASGQERVHVHVFPFRMTDDRMAAMADHPWSPFWQTLKAGYDQFARNGRPPRVGVCDNRYVLFEGGPEEVADPGPLAACGALDEPTEPPPIETANLEKAPASSQPPKSVARPPASAGLAQADLPPPLCRTTLPSCRKWLSLTNGRPARTKVAERTRRLR